MTKWEKTGKQRYNRRLDDAVCDRRLTVQKQGGLWDCECEGLFADVALPDAGTSADAKRQAMKRVRAEAVDEIKSLLVMLESLLEVEV